MYIPEFWCGVFVTIVTECVLLIVAAVISNCKSKKKK